MTYIRLPKIIRNFLANESGETAVQTALLFGFTVFVGTLFTVPMLSSASKRLAYQNSPGIDPVVTSSIGQEGKPTKRYTIRKSIFDTPEQ